LNKIIDGTIGLDQVVLLAGKRQAKKAAGGRIKRKKL